MLTFIFVSLLNIASAQDDTGKPEVTYKKETTIDFEGVDIEGTLVKPQGALLLERKKAHFNPLITLRNNFNKEMNSSVNDIK